MPTPKQPSGHLPPAATVLPLRFAVTAAAQILRMIDTCR